MYENLICSNLNLWILCNVELVLWSRLCVAFAHISDPVVSDLPGMTRQSRQNTSLLLLNGHVDDLGDNTKLFWVVMSPTNLRHGPRHQLQG
jgi:hypothetical protein